MTDLVPTPLAEIQRLLSAGKLTMTELMERLAPKAEPEAAVKPAAPKKITLSAQDKTILRTLPKQLADIEIPDGRAFTKDEADALVPLFDRVKAAKAAVTKAEEALKAAMNGHIDAVTDGPVGKSGNKLTEGEVVADGYDQKVVRYLIGGKAAELTLADVQRMEEDGEIDHKTYLRWTKQLSGRTLVLEAVMTDMAKDGKYLELVAARATRSAQTTGIRMAKS